MNFQLQSPSSSRKPGWERLAGPAIVLALHGVVIYGLLQARLIPAPEEATTLFVNFIASPPPPPLQQQKPPPKPAKPGTPRPPDPHPHLVVKAPAAPNDYVLPAPPPLPPPAPAIEAPPPPPAPPKPTGPVNLSGELALACPTRTPPAYPAMSRRLNEAGKVVLRVELDAEGRVEAAQVASSSGFKRLDEAALNAVRSWRCNPPTREGQAVRAVAMQPFQFNLE